ncbi:hypothetical protein [Paenibacillus rigui]|uniref:Uncharacterized protein n=1 Tax=Paenibacillus rigui TaxID=554312 RepID=A0A229UXM8_9BACL|nr:hypothetical protein [Paenibacillus rigui]OXM88093.1 hypothetical protein CF651_03115 [Paenibacillus rigui]
MKFGSFLLGGLVGAAAVVYFNNKSKSMLLSAFTSNNQSLGHVMDKAKDRFTDQSAEDKAKSKAAANTSFKKDDPFNTAGGGLEKVKDIVKEDPQLKSTVNEILAENDQKEVHTIQ